MTLHVVTGKLPFSLSDAMPMTCFDFFYCQLFLPCYSFVVKIVYTLLCLFITYIASFLSFALKLYGTSTIYFTYLLHWLIPFLMIEGRIRIRSTNLQIKEMYNVLFASRIRIHSTSVQLVTERKVFRIAGRIRIHSTSTQLNRISGIANSILIY